MPKPNCNRSTSIACFLLLNLYIIKILSPSGEKCFSKHDLVRLLGDRVDLSSFDFSSGKVLQSVLRRNKSVRSGNVVDMHKGNLFLY